jgi:hypothetical protein
VSGPLESRRADTLSEDDHDRPPQRRGCEEQDQGLLLPVQGSTLPHEGGRHRRRRVFGAESRGDFVQAREIGGGVVALSPQRSGELSFDGVTLRLRLAEERAAAHAIARCEGGDRLRHAIRILADACGKASPSIQSFVMQPQQVSGDTCSKPRRCGVRHVSRIQTELGQVAAQPRQLGSRRFDFLDACAAHVGSGADARELTRRHLRASVDGELAGIRRRDLAQHVREV